MTRDEKAKAYDKALEMAKNVLETDLHESGVWAIKKIFPELFESEDERIRKFILEVIKAYDGMSNSTKEKCISYLEKQKEASKAIEAVEKVDKYINEHLANAYDMKDSDYKNYYCGWDDALGKIAGILQDVYSGEKMKEQKPVDLAEKEPKKMTKYLRFGDIPENGKSKIWRGEECIGEEEGVSVYEIRFDKDKHISICLPFPFHRDTLDTLCALTKYDNRPCYIVTGEYVGKGTDGESLISNVQIEEEFPKIISDEKMEQIGEEISKAAVDNIREQFNKIVKEKPEQKEQKPVEPSDDELKRHQDELYDFKVFATKQAKEHHISFVHDFEWNNFCAELLSYFAKQKPAEWSKEEQTIIEGACDALEIHGHSKLADKLKSLRPQPHTVSIKDATKFGNLEYERGVKDGIQHAKNHQWKPSEEQMQALSETIEFASDTFKPKCTLVTLQDDLKKLM